MLLRLGLIAYPLVAVAIIALRPGPVARFRRAGATSPDRARRPSGVGIERPSFLADHVRSGVLRQVDGGRYYVDLAVLRRQRRRALVACSIAGLALVVGSLLWLGPR